MSIADIKPSSVPPELRVKIERVMHERNLSWRDTVVFLAREVVSPSGASNLKHAFKCAEGGFTRAMNGAAQDREEER